MAPGEVLSSTSHIPPSPALSSASSDSAADMTLSSLPDELLSMCYSSLGAPDLVALELVSHRMRNLVTADDVAWRACSEQAWGKTHNIHLMAMAAEAAGGWKQLYADKKLVDVSNAPWSVPSRHEVSAIIELIKGSATDSTLKGVESESFAASSPRSVIAGPAVEDNTLSVVLLVDGSSSVTEDDFRAQRNFCTQLVDSLRETHRNASVAVLQFNQYPKIHSGLTDVHQPAILEAIDGMNQMMGSTDIAAPIRRARQMLAEDGSPGKKAIVLITDGQTHSDELRDAEREARQAGLDSGARLFALGVGRDVDEAGLKRVACGTNNVLKTQVREVMATGSYFPLRKMNRSV